MQRLCSANATVQSCYLLDARKSENGDIKLVIALLLENEKEDLVQVGCQIQTLLKEFPQIAPKVAIMSAQPFLQKHKGSEFYISRLLKNPQNL